MYCIVYRMTREYEVRGSQTWGVQHPRIKKKGQNMNVDFGIRSTPAHIMEVL